MEFQGFKQSFDVLKKQSNRIYAAVAIKRSLNDGSRAVVGDSFSESDVGEWIDPERRQNQK